MVERPSLSKGELNIARILWEAGPATVRAVFEACPNNPPIDFSTVQTYLRRLETKGHATSKLDGRVRVYAARTKPKTVIRQTVDDLVGCLFAGDKMPLVRHLIEDSSISADDLDELQKLVKRLAQERKEQS
jgi:predicted transcriptional regulator